MRRNRKAIFECDTYTAVVEAAVTAPDRHGRGVILLVSPGCGEAAAKRLARRLEEEWVLMAYRNPLRGEFRDHGTGRTYRIGRYCEVIEANAIHGSLQGRLGCNTGTLIFILPETQQTMLHNALGPHLPVEFP